MIIELKLDYRPGEGSTQAQIKLSLGNAVVLDEFQSYLKPGVKELVAVILEKHAQQIATEVAQLRR